MADMVYNTKLKEEKQKTAVSSGIRFLQGTLIGLGAVLPGISGGVLCVVFGVYQTIMEILSHPLRSIKKHIHTLFPLILGGGFGFVIVAKLLGFLLDKYPAPSVCLFVGLIIGMIPSLFREAGATGRSRGSLISFGICFTVVLGLLLSLNFIRAEITPNFGWYLFCGFCIALSVIAPGLSFSTLLMPIGLYTPLVTEIGNFNFNVLIPVGAGALMTVVLLAKAVDRLVKRHYSIVFHGIIGVVIAATIVIIPFQSFAVSIASCCVNLICIILGSIIALVIDKFNQKVEVPDV